MYFVAAPEIEQWSDLRGRTAAALTIGSCSYWYMRMLLQSHGLDPDKDVNVIGLGERYARVLELFEAGELQAAIITEPNVSIGEERGIFRIMQVLRDEQYCPNMQWGLMIANQGVIDKEPELVRAVLRAARRSNRYCAEHPDEWVAFGAEHFGIDRETMKRSIERELTGLHYDCELDMNGLQQAIGLQESLGAIKGPMTAADISDLRFLPAAESADAAS
jgi:NitT/TauT family transport system substrate-binding protein